MPPTDAEIDVLGSCREQLARIVARRVGASAVEDVLQEVAVAAVESDRLPECPTQRRHWLAGVALRQCALHHRRTDRRTRMTDALATNGSAHVKSEAVDPMDWLLARESHDQVRVAFAGLHAKTRELLAQKYLEGRTYRQLAEKYRITVHAAEYRLQAAKRALRDRLIDAGFCEETPR